MEALKVFVRIHPYTKEESCIDAENSIVTIQGTKRGKSNSFKFDNVLPESASQVEVFNGVSDFVDESLQGFNATIFAFGMTGSGKTHTISGWLINYFIPESFVMVLLS